VSVVDHADHGTFFRGLRQQAENRKAAQEWVRDSIGRHPNADYARAGLDLAGRLSGDESLENRRLADPSFTVQNQ
jgi:hypothetical protein